MEIYSIHFLILFEKSLTSIWSLATGRNECSRCVPGIIRDIAKSFFREHCLLRVLFYCGVAEVHTFNFWLSKFKELLGSHYLIVIRPLQASPSCNALDCSSNPITWPLSVLGSKEVPFSRHAKIFLVTAEVDEVLPVFVLCSTTIWEIDDVAWVFDSSWEKVKEYLLEEVDCNSVVRLALCYYNKIDVR